MRVSARALLSTVLYFFQTSKSAVLKGAWNIRPVRALDIFSRKKRE